MFVILLCITIILLLGYGRSTDCVAPDLFLAHRLLCVLCDGGGCGADGDGDGDVH